MLQQSFDGVIVHVLRGHRFIETLRKQSVVILIVRAMVDILVLHIPMHQTIMDHNIRIIRITRDHIKFGVGLNLVG
jgi:hypothetical protein|tara:strand:- start:85 stop:312 length:228 start_codon:yes stop_codon:yes gene_type:complete